LSQVSLDASRLASPWDDAYTVPGQKGFSWWFDKAPKEFLENHTFISKFADQVADLRDDAWGLNIFPPPDSKKPR
jgi:hypothetical protein